MRKLQRTEPPQVLIDHGARWNQKWRDRRQENPNAQFQWYKLQNKSVRDWLMPNLRKMSAEHCNFCDRFTVEPETIEHFRPKSEFTDLAYTWENLYFCCGGCQSHKREVWKDTLICPDEDEYSFVRYFRFDFTTGEIKPNPSASAEEQKRAEDTINLYGLDSDERRKHRLLEQRKWNRSKVRDLDDFGYRDFVSPEY